MDVVVGVIAEQGVAQGPLMDEAHAFVHAPGSIVEVVDVELDPLEPKLTESEREHAPKGVAAVSAAGVLGISDRDAEAGAAAAQVHLVQVDPTDGPIVL